MATGLFLATNLVTEQLSCLLLLSLRLEHIVECQTLIIYKCCFNLFQMSLPVVAPGEQVIEMMIPASKVGLIIGKFQTPQPLLPPNTCSEVIL